MKLVVLHIYTVFENHRKSLIQQCERSELRLHFEWTKLKLPKMVHFGEFLKIWSLQSNSVTRQVSFNRTKIGGKCQNKINSNVTFWGIFEYCAHIVFENGPNHTWYCDNSGIITFHFPFLGHFLVLWAQQCFQLCRGSHKLFCLQKVSFNLSRKRRRRKGPLISCYGSILYHNYISSFLFFLS